MRGRPVRADRQHVGRGRLQHPVGRVAGAPDRARQALLPRRARPRDHRPLAPRRVRLLGRAPADPERGGHHVVPHAEDVVERDQPVPAQHVLVGGHRRHADPHALPARRHLQRRHERAASSRRASASSRSSAVSKHSLYPFGYGDGGGGPTRAMLESARRLADLEGAPRVEIDTVASFWEQGARRGAGPPGVGRRALPRVPPGHLHDQRPDQARQPAATSRRCARPSCGRSRRRTATTGARTRRRARRGVEAAAAQPVPRHHPGLEHPLGQRRLPPRPRADRGRSRAELIAAAQRAIVEQVDTRGMARPSSCSTPRRATGASSSRSTTDGGPELVPVAVPACGYADDRPRCRPTRRSFDAVARLGSLARERAAARRAGTTTGCSRRSSTRSTAARCSRPARAPTCSSSTRTTRSEFDAWNVDIDYLDHRVDLTDDLVDRGGRARSAPRRGAVRPRSFGDFDDHADDAARRADRGGSSSRPRSTGTSTTSS